MSTTEATGVEVGTPVRFTADRLGLLADPAGNQFAGECVGEGDVGAYHGLHPSEELAAKDWHLIKVARAAHGGTGVADFAEGEERYCPVHRLQFEAIEEEPTEPDGRAEVVAAIRELADFLEANPAVPLPNYVMASRWADRDTGKAEIVAVGGEIKVDHGEVVAERHFGSPDADVSIKVAAKAENVCVEREVTKTEFVLPPELDTTAEVTERVVDIVRTDDLRGEADR